MRAVPRLRSLKGRGCHFTEADLLALALLRTATRVLGCSIGFIGPSVDPMFDILASRVSGELLSKAMVIEDGTVRLVGIPFSVSGQFPMAIIPLKPLIDAIHPRDEHLLPLERLMLQDR